MGQRGPKARREAGPGQGFGSKSASDPGHYPAEQPQGETQEAAAETVTVLCQLEVGGAWGGIPGVLSPWVGLMEG